MLHSTQHPDITHMAMDPSPPYHPTSPGQQSSHGEPQAVAAALASTQPPPTPCTLKLPLLRHPAVPALSYSSMPSRGRPPTEPQTPGRLHPAQPQLPALTHTAPHRCVLHPFPCLRHHTLAGGRRVPAVSLGSGVNTEGGRLGLPCPRLPGFSAESNSEDFKDLESSLASLFGGGGWGPEAWGQGLHLALSHLFSPCASSQAGSTAQATSPPT